MKSVVKCLHLPCLFNYPEEAIQKLIDIEVGREKIVDGLVKYKTAQSLWENFDYDKFFNWLAIVNFDIFNRMVLEENLKPIEAVKQTYLYHGDIKNVFKYEKSDAGATFCYFVTPQEYERAIKLLADRYHDDKEILPEIYGGNLISAGTKILEDTDFDVDCDEAFWGEFYKMNIKAFLKTDGKQDGLVDRIIKGIGVANHGNSIEMPSLVDDDKRYEVHDSLMDRELSFVGLKEDTKDKAMKKKWKKVNELLGDCSNTYEDFYLWFAAVHIKMINYVIMTHLNTKPIDFIGCGFYYYEPFCNDMCFYYEVDSKTHKQIEDMLKKFECKDMKEFLDKHIKPHMDDCNKVLAEETECVDFKMFFSCSVDEYNNKLCDIIEDSPYTFRP